MSAMLEAMKKAGLITAEKAQQADKENQQEAGRARQFQAKQKERIDNAREAFRRDDMKTFLDNGRDFILEGIKESIGEPPNKVK